MRAAGTDAVGALRWGLRRHRVLFVACFLLGAVLAPAIALQRATPADAEALVIAQRLDMSLVALPRYGEAVFDNGQVAQAVAARFGEGGDHAGVVPNRVSLVADQDSIVFHVVGHDVDPRTAADIANTAADAFIQALNAPGVGVGAFALQSPAEPPAETGGRIRTLLAVPVGILAGLVLGLAAVSVLLVARRPVIDAADAEDATGVLALGTVTVPRTRPGVFARPEEFSGLVPVCRRLLSLPTPTVALASRPREARVRTQLSVALARVLMRAGDVRFLGPSDAQEIVARRKAAGGPPTSHPEGVHRGDRPRVTLIDSTEPLDLLQSPQSSTTVLVVPEGIGSATLRAAVVDHLGGSAEARLLLVRRGRRSRGEAEPGADATDGSEELEAAAVAKA
jgi:capsular polysaccharide biosynthesis protein